MNETEERLADLDDEYENADTPEPGQFDPLPNGKYQVKVEEVCIDESQAGNLMLQWQLRVISGKFIKRMVFKNHMLQSADNMKFLKGDLATCGIKLNKLSELPSRLAELLDIILEVNIKSKEVDGQTRSNVYFNTKLMQASDIPSDSGSQGNRSYNSMDDDIPF
jgi:hypothetical protein